MPSNAFYTAQITYYIQKEIYVERREVDSNGGRCLKKKVKKE